MKTLLFAALILLGAGAVHGKVVTQPVAYEHEGVKLEGFLAYDDAKVSASKKAPLVLVLPEWWGLNSYAKSRAEDLAKLGYVGFAVDMYGKGVTTEDPKVAGELAGQFYGKPLMATRARAGLDQALKSPVVDTSRVAAIGFCFGGAVSQALAYQGAPLRGIVSFHGSLIPASAEAKGANRAKFLILHGAVDPFIKPEELTAFVSSLDAGGFDYQFISYSGAVHAFTNPGADALAKKTGLKGIGYNAPAARRSQAHMEIFLKELFQK
ncbi:MAG TPA: dienelactone hydrolase family protein [Opitutaceae bacterium]|nr:dienelactone hydrolase family protein [Opitutaceae bacterium]